MTAEFLAGTIPARGFDWDAVVFPARRVGDFADLAYGKGLVEGSRKPGNVPVFGTNGRCGWHDSALRSGPGVILGRKGQGPLGVEWCDEPFWVIDTAYVASVIPSEADLKWFYYVTKYVGLNHLKTGEKPGLQRDTFRAQLFPFPNKPIQSAIAAVLGALDEKIHANHRTNYALEALASALFKSWFVDFDPVVAKRDGKTQVGVPADVLGLFPSHFEDSELGPIPEGWRVSTLADMAETQYGYTASATSLPTGPRLLRITDMNKAPWIDWSTVPFCQASPAALERYGLKVGDIVVSRMADPGKAGIVEEPVDAVFASYLVRLSVPQARRYWTYYFLRSTLYLEYAEGAQGGTVQSNMNARVITAVLAPIPTEDLSRAFDELVRPLRAQIVANLSEDRTLASLRNVLLPALLSGEITLKIAEKTVAEVV